MALVPLCAEDDVWDIYPSHQVLADGRKLADVNLGGEILATDDTCTHGAASLSEDGSVDGAQVECSWHNGRFDIRDGSVRRPPPREPLKTYPVRERGGTVYLQVR